MVKAFANICKIFNYDYSVHVGDALGIISSFVCLYCLISRNFGNATTLVYM